MIEPQIVKLEKRHLEKISSHAFTPEDITSLLSFPSFALEYGRETVAVGGAIPIWTGRVRLWLLCGALASQFCIRIFRASRKFTALALSENHRVECLCEDNLSARVAKMLSYRQECIIHNYKPDKDAKMFSLVR